MLHSVRTYLVPAYFTLKMRLSSQAVTSPLINLRLRYKLKLLNYGLEVIELVTGQILLPIRQYLMRWEKKYQLYFNWTAKDKKRHYLEALRAFIGQGGLVLSPSSILHKTMFENTIWKDDHSEFGRSASGFHGDCIDSTLYMYRNLITTNPVPSLNGVDFENVFIKSVSKMDEKKDIAEWISAGLDDAMTEDTTGKDQGDVW